MKSVVRNWRDPTHHRKVKKKAYKPGKAIPIIAMTANAFTEDRLRAKEAGMDEHISKPVDVRLLVKVICKLQENTKESGKKNE